MTSPLLEKDENLQKETPKCPMSTASTGQCKVPRKAEHEICFLPLFVRREITQQVWRCSSHHIVSNVSEAWVNSCEARDELESPLVVTPFQCAIEARQFSQVSRIQANIVLVQIRVRIVSLLRHHIEMRHRHHDHFVKLRNDLEGITSLMNHQVQHVMDDHACNAQDD